MNLSCECVQHFVCLSQSKYAYVIYDIETMCDGTEMPYTCIIQMKPSVTSNRCQNFLRTPFIRKINAYKTLSMACECLTGRSTLSVQPCAIADSTQPSNKFQNR